jgi:acyl carrier protein
MKRMPANSETIDGVRAVLTRSLQLGARGAALARDTPLLGGLPELDSMAVVHVLTALEENFGIIVSDDDVSAETFATFGSLADFVESKLAD